MSEAARSRLCVSTIAALMVASFSVANADSASDSLTIAQCIRMARNAAPGMRAALADAFAARFDSITASRNRRPAYSLIGGALVAPRRSYDPAITNLGEYHLQARAEWPLADGGLRERERRRSAIALDRAGIESRRAGRDAAIAAANAAIELLRLGEDARVREGTLEWVQRLLRRIEQGVRAGVHGRGDEQRVELARDAVSADLLAIHEDSEIVGRELARALGVGLGPRPTIVAPPASDQLGPSRADTLALFEALSQTPEKRLADLEIAERRLDFEEARNRGAFEVDLAGDAGLHGSDLTRVVPDDLLAENPNATFHDRLRRDLGASLAIELKRPILDASQASRIRARRWAESSARFRAEETRSDRLRFGYDLLTRWRAAAARLDTASATVARAERHVLRLESLYAGGGASLLELLDARQVLDDALGRESNARADVRRARYETEAQR